jgi:hypothetical protein
LEETLNPLGVAVVIEARHFCMMMRGVQKQNSVTTTSAFNGQFEDSVTRSEFIKLISSKLELTAMVAYVFPGQGAQFKGMGKDLYDTSILAQELFQKANEILGFDIADVMFNGTDEDLKKTEVTQPAVFIHSVVSFLVFKTKDSANGGRSFIRRVFGIGS